MVETSGAVVALAGVRAKIDAAAREAGRAPSGVTLVAVTKTFEADAIRPVLAAGHRVFGENRVQEAKGKWPALRAQFPDVRLHLIGPLQSNKAAEAVALFDCLQTIDRPKIAEAVATEIKKQSRRPELYVQVNTGEEAQKAGVAPREAVAFVQWCRGTVGLEIAGLMCIPPAEDMPAPHFAFLRMLAGEAGVSGKNLGLSMGMSSDYECAVSLGATCVRVGSAIFGGR